MSVRDPLRPRAARLGPCVLLGILTLAATSGCMGPDPQLRTSMLRSRQLYDQNRWLAMERDQARGSANAMAADKQRIEQQAAALQHDLEIANQRLANLGTERTQLQERYVTLLNQVKGQGNPLSPGANQRFQELAKKYPEFEFDPQTGISKFNADIVFSSGSADLKPSAQQLLQEFARIMNDGEAQRLNVLVVGHTDDRPIVKGTTKAQHPTNWHLSTDRANSVVLALSRSGLKENRMGAAGYSMFQPVHPNKDDSARQKNRRVEIFVLAPDASIAGWDPGNVRN